MGTDYHYLYIGTYTSIEAQGCRREDACGREIYLFERQEDGALINIKTGPRKKWIRIFIRLIILLIWQWTEF